MDGYFPNEGSYKLSGLRNNRHNRLIHGKLNSHGIKTFDQTVTKIWPNTGWKWFCVLVNAIYIKSYGGQLGLVPRFGSRYVFRLFHFAIFDVFICPWAGVMDCDIAAVPGPKVNHIFHASLSFAASLLSS